MIIQNEAGETDPQQHGAPTPHVVPPPATAAAPPAEGEAPRQNTTQHRSAASVALHWALMAGGFVALVALGQWLL